jgi:hypothetical protein
LLLNGDLLNTFLADPDALSDAQAAEGAAARAAAGRVRHAADGAARLAVSAACLDAAGRRLVVAFAGGLIRMFNTANGDCVRALGPQPLPIACVASTPSPIVRLSNPFVLRL